MVGKAKEGVGLALIRHHHQRAHQQNRHSKNANRPLESVTDISNLDEVMEQAELAGHVFSTLNPLPHLLVSQEATESSDHRKQQQKIEEALFSSYLKIPRRPRWHVGITPEELDAKERQEFLNWRRSLVRLEDLERLIITPFEKNIDIWRQLWRVLERSDLVVMVVDARDPLFYRCPDLEDYIKEIDNNKRTMLLLNKADLLPLDARLEWARYLRSQNISFVFWSAKLATGKADYNFDRSTDLQMRSDLNERRSEDQLDEDIRILDREELLDRLQCEADQVSEIRTMASVASIRSDWNENDMPRKTNDEDVKSAAGLVSAPVKHAVVGFVGYPNVGKSSTINALVGEKRTGVTSTPGKTKHFQTLVISDKLTLCDCPGLVFPSFSYSRSDMVALGVLPIDKMTDHRGPIQVVAEQVARARLEEAYGIRLPKPKPYEPQDRPPSAAELLITLARARGYVSSSGLADETRAARLIMKDYVNGKLLHYELPPNTGNAARCQSDATELSLPGDVGSDSNLTLMQVVVAPVDSSKDDICLDRIEINESVTERECSQIGITMCNISYERTGSLLGAAVTKSSEEDVISSVEKVPSAGEVHASSDKEQFVSADIRRNDDSERIADRNNSNSNMSTVLDDLAAFDLMNGLNATKSANKKQTSVKTLSSHKMHKKAPRRKDRSWRAGDTENDVMPLVRGVSKAVSHGAAQLSQAAI